MSGSGSLEDARARIDAIDAEMHDLLMTRTEIVRDVAAAKANAGATGLSIRPGREAEVVRRLLNRHKGALPKAVIFRLWREIITAKAQIQTPFSVVVAAGGADAGLRDICRAHFGSNTEMLSLPTEKAVLGAVLEDSGSKVGVVSLTGDGPAPWWITLADWQNDKRRNGKAVPTIVARLPFCHMEDGSGGGQGEAFSIACLLNEETGNDRTVIVVRQNSEGLQKKSAVSVLARDAAADGATLLEVAGFFSDLKDVALFPDGDENCTIVGTYAVPFTVD